MTFEKIFVDKNKMRLDFLKSSNYIEKLIIDRMHNYSIYLNFNYLSIWMLLIKFERNI